MFTAIHMNIISSEQRAEQKQNTLLTEVQKKELKVLDTIDSVLDLITNKEHKKIAKEILRASDEELYCMDENKNPEEWTNIQKIVDVLEYLPIKDLDSYDRTKHQFYREEYKSLYNIVNKMWQSMNSINNRLNTINRNTQKKQKQINYFIKNFTEFLITENIDSVLDLITNKEHKKIAKEILRASDEELYGYDIDGDKTKLTDIQKIVDVPQTGNRKDNKFYKEKDENLYNIIFNMFNMGNEIDYRVNKIHKNTQKNTKTINYIINKFTEFIKLNSNK